MNREHTPRDDADRLHDAMDRARHEIGDPQAAGLVPGRALKHVMRLTDRGLGQLVARETKRGRCKTINGESWFRMPQK